MSAPQPTVQIGAHLHVLTVVLDSWTPGGNAARSGGATLEANHTFSYDIQLIERADPRSSTTCARSACSTIRRRSDTTRGNCRRSERVRRSSIASSSSMGRAGNCSRRRHSRTRPENDPLPGDTEIDDETFVPPGIDSRANPTSSNWPRERPTVDSPRHDGKPYPFPPDEYPQLPKRDGMVWIDALIDARGPSPLVQRPINCS